jgi:primary-amine oxidase
VQIALQHPNKSLSVPFLNDGDASAPARYARATVMFGATNLTDLYWQEFAIGPLPVNNSTSITPLTFPFNNENLGKTKVHPVFSPTDAMAFQTKLSSDIEDVTKMLWNSVGDLESGQ